MYFRHGERTLAVKFPTDEYAMNSSVWPDGDGMIEIVFFYKKNLI